MATKKAPPPPAKKPAAKAKPGPASSPTAGPSATPSGALTLAELAAKVADLQVRVKKLEDIVGPEGTEVT